MAHIRFVFLCFVSYAQQLFFKRTKLYESCTRVKRQQKVERKRKTPKNTCIQLEYLLQHAVCGASSWGKMFAEVRNHPYLCVFAEHTYGWTGKRLQWYLGTSTAQQANCIGINRHLDLIFKQKVYIVTDEYTPGTEEVSRLRGIRPWPKQWPWTKEERKKNPLHIDCTVDTFCSFFFIHPFASLYSTRDRTIFDSIEFSAKFLNALLR